MNTRPIALLVLACLLTTGTFATAADPADEQSAQVTRLGVSLGTPAGLNFVATSDLSWTTIAFSGMYWGSGDDGLRGAQIGASIVRSRRTKNFKSLNVIAGISETEERDWSYAGLEGFFSWKSFFLQPGLTIGSGDYSSPQISAQLGFLWSL